MSRSICYGLFCFLFLIFSVSCSGGGGGITTPDPIPGIPAQENTGSLNNEVQAETGHGQTYPVGLWQFVADKATGQADLVQLRSAEKILNVLGFMEPPVLTLMDLDWPDLHIDYANGTIDVGVKLTHPLGKDPNNTFTGFDVRGVCFGPEVTNADGLTIIPSPEFFTGVPFGYKDGLLGAPAATYGFDGLAGYKYYCDGLGEDTDLPTFFSNTTNINNRGKFSGITPHQRNYHLDWKGTGYSILVFNYAIYANFEFPTGAGPYQLDDFDITTSNSAEAFCAKVTETDNSLFYAGSSGGGAISLDVEAWDWQGDISYVSIESGSIIPIEIVSMSLVGSTPKSSVFQFSNIPGTPTAAGDLDILVTVVDPKTFGECWFLDLLPPSNLKYNKPVYDCWIYRTTVTDCPAPVVTHINPTDHDPDNVQFGATITGNNFLAGPSLGVRLKKTGQTDIVATNVGVANTTSISCKLTIPMNTAAGGWDVEVTNGCGTVGVAQGIFGIACDSPMVTGSIPEDHNPDGSNFNVGISGSSFINGTDLGVKLARFGETDIIASNVSYVSANYLTCTFNIPFGTAVGQWNIIVTNGCGTMGAGVDLFTVNCPTPSVTSINPGDHLPNGVTYPASVIGTDFYSGGSLDVRLQKSGQDDILASGMVYVSPMQINCSFNIPFGTEVGTWDVRVTSGCGAAGVGNDIFTVTCPAPEVTSVNPGSHTPDNTLFAANVYGSDFISGGSLDVKLKKSGQGDITATGATFINSGQINCDITLPIATAIGDWDVEVTNGCGTPGTGSGLFQVICPTPTVTNMNPNISRSNGDINATIAGTNFLSGVELDARLKKTGQTDIIGSNVIVVNPTTITATFDVTGAVQGTWDLQVTNGCGQVGSKTGALIIQSGWARTWGGASTDFGNGVATDASGNIYVTGYFNGSGVNFNPGGSDLHSSNGGADIFLSKFDINGVFQWARTWGGSIDDYGNGVTCDTSGNVYVTGFFAGTNVNFNPGGSDPHSSNGSTDIFISKFNSSGTFQSASTWGSSGQDYGWAVAVESSGNVCVTGYFTGANVNFNPAGLDLHSSNGGSDAFASVYNSTGTFQWARTWGGTGNDIGLYIATDTSGNVYVTGNFSGSNVNFNPGGSDPHSSNGGYDIFVSKFNSGGTFQWARTWGGSQWDYGWGIATDSSGSVYLTGGFGGSNVNFNPGGSDLHSSNGGYDVFFSKFNSAGTFQWARTWGGSSDDYGEAVTAYGSGDVYVTGYFTGSNVNFNPGGSDPHSSNGAWDTFFSKFNSSGTFQWARTWGGTGSDIGFGVATDSSGLVYVTGGYNGSGVDFDPGAGSDPHTSSATDIYLTKFFPDGYW